jgi:hypothetical protein
VPNWQTISAKRLGFDQAGRSIKDSRRPRAANHPKTTEVTKANAFTRLSVERHDSLGSDLPRNRDCGPVNEADLEIAALPMF